MSQFLTALQMELVRDAEGVPLKNRSGRQLYRLLQPLVYLSALIGKTTVPADYITDLGSVPRLPFIYALFGDSFQMAAVVHDYLYSEKSGNGVSRSMADSVLVEACDATKEPWWKSRGSWAAVRLLGWTHY